jgi:hypothetical protein
MMIKLDNESSVDFDKITKSSLTYLENIIAFLKTLSEKIPDEPKSEIFQKIVIEFEAHRNHLVKTLKQRNSRVKDNTAIPISTIDLAFLEAILGTEMFRKPHIGKNLACRVVSFEEGIQKSINAHLMGLAYFTHLPRNFPRSYQRWVKTILPALRTHLFTLLNCYNRDKRSTHRR